MFCSDICELLRDRRKKLKDNAQSFHKIPVIHFRYVVKSINVSRTIFVYLSLLFRYFTRLGRFESNASDALR